MSIVSILWRQSIKVLNQKLWEKLIGPCMYYNNHHVENMHEKLSKFSQLSFCQNCFFQHKISSCKCPMCLYCGVKVSKHSIHIWKGGTGIACSFAFYWIYAYGVKLQPEGADPEQIDTRHNRLKFWQRRRNRVEVPWFSRVGRFIARVSSWTKRN